MKRNNWLQNQQRKRGYKRKGMKFNAEFYINFVLKIILGGLAFWVMYFPIYITQQMILLTQMSYIMLFSVAASFVAMLLSYFLVCYITKILKRPRRKFRSLNGDQTIDNLIYEMIAVTINALAVSAGVIIFLDQQTTSWEMFFLVYFALKIFNRIFAFALAAILSKNPLFVMGFCLLFFALLSISLLELTQITILAK